MKKTILALALSFGIAAANAAGLAVNLQGQQTSYSGGVQANTNSVTVGGSQAGTNSNSNGTSSQYTKNNGSSYSYAGGTITRNEATTHTGGGSESNSYSKSITSGSATGDTSGGVGNDYNAKAWSQINKNSQGFDAFTKMNVGFTN